MWSCPPRSQTSATGPPGGKYRKRKIQNYRNAGIHKYSNVIKAVIGPRNSEIHEYRDTEIQKYSDDLEAVIGPAAELHLAILFVEWEPGDVDAAGGLEDAGGEVGAQARGAHDHVRGVRAVKLLVRTGQNRIYLGVVM